MDQDFNPNAHTNVNNKCPEKLNWMKNGKCKVSVKVGRVKGKCKNVGQDYNPYALLY